ncbi:MAG: ATP-binding cassette domain-containing protein [Oligoflexia bacterium]|nr:ATP-binding cassette domain-containing protein [Oligoflexia bacterium]
MINVSNITKSYGDQVLYQSASFSINAGEKVGLVGPNGAGKTTIFRLITGEESVDSGVIAKTGKPLIGYFSQNIEDMKGRSAIAEVISAVGLEDVKNRLSELEAKLSEPLEDDLMAKVLEEYGELQVQFEHMGGYDVETRAAEILTGLGIGPEDYHRQTESFSGGWKMRIALAKILALQPDLLLMDEPTNHLDMESIIWLEEWIRNFKGAVLMTSHDREFMNRIISRIVEVSNKTVSLYSGDYDFYDREREVRRQQLIATAKRQEDMLAKEEEFIARFAARASHAAQVQSRVKKLEKIERVEIPPDEKVINLEWPVPTRGGDDVVKIENLGKIWKTDQGKEKLVFQNANAIVRRLDRIAVVGVNGAGKSTLLKIIVGHAEATSGNAILGNSISVGYFSQNSMDILDSSLTVFEELHNSIPNASIGFVRTILGAFKFSGDDVEKKISVLSGGEKSRLVLATILAKAPNFLVLDEPTNHLDIRSREVLLGAIKNFPGTVMVVSHDRFFLREITSRVFELDKNQLLITDANWDYYISKKKLN